MFSLSSIGANVASKIENVLSKDKTASLKSDKASLFNFAKNENSSVELDSNFDEFIPRAEKYKAASWDKTERAAGNGVYDVDSRQGNIGDCGLLSTLRALRNSEAGQKALSEVMNYDAENGSWSFNFKTKDFDGTNPIVVTKTEVDEAVAAKRISKGDDDVSATELAVEKYFMQIGKDTENNTKDKTMKQIADIQNRARDKRAAAGMEDKGYLDGISPYIGYLFTGKVPELMKATDESMKQRAQEFLTNFDAATDMLVFSQINSAGVAESGGDSIYTMIGDDQVLQNHAYTVCGVDGNNVTLRESNNPAATIVVTMDELLNCAGKNSFYGLDLAA